MKYQAYQNLLKEKELENKNNNNLNNNNSLSSINRKIKEELTDNKMTIPNSTEGKEPESERERIREAGEQYRRLKYNFVV